MCRCGRSLVWSFSGVIQCLDIGVKLARSPMCVIARLDHELIVDSFDVFLCRFLLWLMILIL